MPVLVLDLLLIQELLAHILRAVEANLALIFQSLLLLPQPCLPRKLLLRMACGRE